MVQLAADTDERSGRRLNARFESVARSMTATRVAHGVMMAGILLLSVQYAHNRSLWLDEAWMAITITESSYAELLAPLDRDQVAPAGYLIVTRGLTQVLGDSEYVLRLLPFLLGLISIPLLFLIARQMLSPPAVVLALLFYILAPAIVYYASEVKPYGVDVSVAVVIILTSIRYLRRNALLSDAALLCAVGAVAVWLSFPAAFMLAAAGLTAVAYFGRLGRRDALLKTAVVGVVWTASFALLYLLTLRQATGNAALMSYWGSAFPPVDVSLHGARKLVEWLGYNFERTLGRPLGFHFGGLASVLLICGVYSLFRRKWHYLLLLALPVGIVLGAAFVRAYPFADRLLLFSAPGAFLIAAEGFDWLRLRVRSSARAVPYLVVGLLLLPTGYSALYHILRPPVQYAPGENAREAVAHLLEQHRDGDDVYVYPTAEGVFRYYRRRLGAPRLEYSVLDVGLERSGFGFTTRDDWESHARAMDSLQGRRRVWLLISPAWHGWVSTHRDYYLERLGKMGVRLDAFRTRGSEVYLYRTNRAPVEAGV